MSTSSDSTSVPTDFKMSKKEFETELQRLESIFDAMPPELELIVRDPSIDLEGYLVISNTLASINGPLGRCGKGGTRISASVTLPEVAMLARSMTLKNAAAGLPLGGAKSAIKADPDEPNFEKKYRRFVRLLKPVLIENGGTFGGFGFDIGAHPKHAIWACDELKSMRCFTGKPVEMGGTDYDKEGIAGLGVATSAKAAIEFVGKSLENVTAAVQGLGAMGSAVIRYFTEFGGTVTYISDPLIGGTYHFPKGIPSEIRNSIVTHDLKTAKSLIEAGGFKHLELDAVLYQAVDITFPCAFQNVIDETSVDRIASRLVVEGANNPCSESARSRLFEKNVTVVPDFIANPGGIIAAFVELTSTVSPEQNARTRKKRLRCKRVDKREDSSKRS